MGKRGRRGGSEIDGDRDGKRERIGWEKVSRWRSHMESVGVVWK